MKYLHGSRLITLTIEADKHPKWRVDSSYTVHPDMWSHSGVYMTLDKGATHSGSFEKKFDTKSSTKAELMAINDEMGQILWMRHFLTDQGEYLPTTTVYRYNKSTILLAENGRSSSSKWKRHLNVWYFFVMDKIKKGELQIAFCPTTSMIGDFFTNAAAVHNVCAYTPKHIEPAC